MAHLPSHPDTDGDSGSRPEHGPPRAKRRWASVVWVAVVVAVVVAMVVLHLAGVVGPGAH